MRRLTEARKRRIAEVAEARHDGIIVLEDIHDPHNAEAVVRTCDALGFGKVCLIFEKEKKFNPKRLGRVTSASANKWIEFSMYTSIKKCLKDLHRKGYTVLGTVLDRSAHPLQRANFKKVKIALMLGNEHRGLSEGAIRGCDALIYIPMRGMVQSLNLSVTAAICMWEVIRQRNGSKRFLLSKKERAKLMKLWSQL